MARARSVFGENLLKLLNMPELPEVETIVRYLRPLVRGKRILGFEARASWLFRSSREYTNLKSIYEYIKGRKITELSRVGKNIVFRLSGGKYFLIHLMMTGKLLWNPMGERKHDRLVIKLSGNNKLVFNDLRMFGRCQLISPEKLLLGQDAFTIKFAEFKNLFSGKKGMIKSLLMNQKILAGLGNIYADEILWYAGVGPTRDVSTLTALELERLYISVKKVLQLAIKKGGTSSRDYLKPDGSKGDYYEIRRVYQRTGEKCVRDGAIIKRIKIGGRPSHFCPRHQK